MTTAHRSRLDWIDTLRGVAVLFVFGLHSMLDVQRHATNTGTVIPGLDVYTALTFGWLDFGKIGVGIFFIVSGFLIPVTLDKPSESAIRGFVVNRVFRLYPAYWLSIAVLLLLIGTELSKLQIVINLTMLQRFVGVPDLNGVFWTLQIELVFYAACVGLKALGRLRDVRVLIAVILASGLFAVALAAARYQTSIKLPVALLLALQLMFFGYIYRLWLVSSGVSRAQMLHLLLVVLATLAIACPLAYSHDYGLGERWQRYLASYWLALAVFIASSKAAFRSGILAFVGRISYSFYLLHTICLGLVMSLVLREVLPLHSGLGLVGYIVSGLGLSILASWLSYVLVERPCISRGQALAASISTTPSPSTRVR